MRELQLQQQQQQHQLQQQPSLLIRPKPLQIQDASSIQRESSIQRQPSIQRQVSIPPPPVNRQYDLQSPIAPQFANVYPSAPSPNNSEQTANEITYRNTESHPDKLNYPNAAVPPSPYQQLSPISPLNTRYSVMGDPAGNQRVSEELRSQLPWSYTSMPPPVPKKPQKPVYPDIPNPDYGN